MERLKKIYIIVSANFFLLILLLIGTEILLQIVYRIRYGEYLFATKTINSEIFEIHPYLVGRLKASVQVEKDSQFVTTTHFHTRWTGASEDQGKIRIAVLGGSTTFGTGVSDKDSWPALLQQVLGEKYAITNFGFPGYSTAENIIQMALVVPEKKPHFVLFYEGWNDISNYHYSNKSYDYYEHGIRQYKNLDIQIDLNSFLKNMFAITWFIDKLKGKYMADITEIELFDKPDIFIDEIYKKNLKILRVLSHNINAFPIFIPQILNYTAFEKRNSYSNWTPNIKDSSMSILMRHLNSQMIQICSKNENKCAVLSEVLHEKWSADDFVDDGHFSRLGGEKFAKIIAHYLHRIGSVSGEKIKNLDSLITSQ